MSNDATPRLALPYLAAAQAQKHVTLNEALGLLDGLVQAAIISRTVAAEPVGSAEGDAYLLPPGATGSAWTTFAVGDLVRFEAGAWMRLSAPEGLLAYVRDEGRVLLRTAADWTTLEAALRRLSMIERLGVGAAPDDLDRVAVASESVRLSHIGGDLRLKLNKAASAATGSVLFQTGFSGRAEVGLTGTDDLTVKVSADGQTWRDAMQVRGGDGAVSLPGGQLAVAAPSFAATAYPDGVFAAKLVNTANTPVSHGALVANMWLTADSFALLVGSTNAGVAGASFKPFFAVRGNGQAEFHNSARLSSMAKAALPPAADHGAGALLFVVDEVGGPTPAFSDGTQWRRVADRAVVA